jgi:GAF domain-containing protein
MTAEPAGDRTAPMDDRELVEYFADLARQLTAISGVEETMGVIVSAAAELLGCDHVSLSYLHGTELRSASSNDDVGPLLDALQTELQEGPCLDVIRAGGIVVTDDLASDGRWPRYGPRASAVAGVVSSMGTELHDGRRTVGALNLFSSSQAHFGPEDGRDALVAVLSAHATPALAAALERQAAAAALATRDLIGQAKGILMARSGVDANEAFRLLVRASQRTNVKVAEIARDLVARNSTKPAD